MEKKCHKTKEKWLAIFKFVPLLVFGVMVIAFKMDLLLAAPIAVLTAIAVYMVINKCNFDTAF